MDGRRQTAHHDANSTSLKVTANTQGKLELSDAAGYTGDDRKKKGDGGGRDPGSASVDARKIKKEQSDGCVAGGAGGCNVGAGGDNDASDDDADDDDAADDDDNADDDDDDDEDDEDDDDRPATATTRGRPVGRVGGT